MMCPTLTTIFWLYLFCYVGNYFTEEFSRLGDAIYQLDWYMLPINLQKDLPIALALVQKDIFLQAYGGIGFTVVNFHKVINSKRFTNSVIYTNLTLLN